MCVMSSEHVPDLELHGPVASGRGEHFQSATEEPTPGLGDVVLPWHMEGTVRGVVMKAARDEGVRICGQSSRETPGCV